MIPQFHFWAYFWRKQNHCPQEVSAHHAIAAVWPGQGDNLCPSTGEWIKGVCICIFHNLYRDQPLWCTLQAYLLGEGKGGVIWGKSIGVHITSPLVAQLLKNPPAMQETPGWSLGQKDPLEKGWATHSSVLAWRSPWTEEPGGLQPMGLQRLRYDWATNTTLFTRVLPNVWEWAEKEGYLQVLCNS